MIKICEFCGKEFNANRAKAKFCSRECSHKNMNKKITCKCDNCGKNIEKKRDEYNKSKNHFCSQECKAMYGHELRKCKLCGTIFDTTKGANKIYCSHECAINDISHNQLTNRELIVCKECGNSFEAVKSAHQSFCSMDCKYSWLKRHPSQNTVKMLANRKRSSVDNFYLKYNNMDTTIELLDEYIPGNKIHCKCKIHGQEFYMTPYNILEGKNGCTQCYMSKGENKIGQYLTSNNIDYCMYYKFDDCKDQRALPFDFYLPDYNILIEYDGEQHYHPVNYGGISDEEANKNFNVVQKHDRIKTNYCKQHGIPLIRIPYFEYDNIENILEQQIA